MKNSINCMKNLIAKILIVSIILAFSTMPVFASSNSDLYPYLQTNQGYYWYSYNGTTSTITSGTKLGNLIGQLGGNISQSLSYIYSVLNSIKGYVDNVEGYIDGIETSLTTSNTHLNAIKGYVDQIEGYVDGIEGALTTSNTHLGNIKSSVDDLEGYVDGIETAFTTNNTRLNEIKSAIQAITTYNYTQVLNDILSNTGYLSVIDTYTQNIYDSIGAGTSESNLQSKLLAIAGYTSDTKDNTSAINTKAQSILEQYAVGNHTFKLLSFGSTQYTPENANRQFTIVDNTPNSMSYIGYRNANSGGYSLYSSTVNTLGNRISIMNNNILQLFTAIFSVNTFYRLGVPNYQTGAITGMRSYSVMDSLSSLQYQASQFFARLGFVIADDDTISAKQANKPQEQSVLSNFTGSGDASASVSDISTAKDTLVGVKSGLNTGTSATQIIGVFNNDEGYNWFSNAVAQDINPSNTRSNGTKGYSTPLLDEKMNALYSVMGVKHD